MATLNSPASALPAALTIADQPDPDGDGPLVEFTRVSLDPEILTSETLYIIDILKGVEDLGGRTLRLRFGPELEPLFEEQITHAEFRDRNRG